MKSSPDPSAPSPSPGFGTVPCCRSSKLRSATGWPTQPLRGSAGSAGSARRDDFGYASRLRPRKSHRFWHSLKTLIISNLVVNPPIFGPAPYPNSPYNFWPVEPEFWAQKPDRLILIGMLES